MEWMQTYFIISTILWANLFFFFIITSRRIDRMENFHREDMDRMENFHRQNMKRVDEKWERIFENLKERGKGG